MWIYTSNTFGSRRWWQIKEAEEQLKRYENRKQYLLNKIENIRSLVLPKGISIEPEKIPSTKRTDKNLEYVMQLEDIEQELKYINKEIENLIKYINNELKIRNQYTTLERKIVDLREDNEYLKTHNKRMPFWKIGKLVGYSPAQCYRIYKNRKYETKWNKAYYIMVLWDYWILQPSWEQCKSCFFNLENKDGKVWH